VSVLFLGHSGHGSIFSVLDDLSGPVLGHVSSELLGHLLVEVVVGDLVEVGGGAQVGAGLLVDGHLVGLRVLVGVLRVHVVLVRRVRQTLPAVESVQLVHHRLGDVLVLSVVVGDPDLLGALVAVLGLLADGELVVGNGLHGAADALGTAVLGVLQLLDLAHGLLQQLLAFAHSGRQFQVLSFQVSHVHFSGLFRLLLDQFAGLGDGGGREVVLLVVPGDVALLLERGLEVLADSGVVASGLHVVGVGAHHLAQVEQRPVLVLAVERNVRPEIPVEPVVRDAVDQFLLGELVGVPLDVLALGVLDAHLHGGVVGNGLHRVVVVDLMGGLLSLGLSVGQDRGRGRHSLVQSPLLSHFGLVRGSAHHGALYKSRLRFLSPLRRTRRTTLNLNARHHR